MYCQLDVEPEEEEEDEEDGNAAAAANGTTQYTEARFVADPALCTYTPFSTAPLIGLESLSSNSNHYLHLCLVQPIFDAFSQGASLNPDIMDGMFFSFLSCLLTTCDKCNIFFLDDEGNFFFNEDEVNRNIDHLDNVLQMPTPQEFEQQVSENNNTNSGNQFADADEDEMES